VSKGPYSAIDWLNPLHYLSQKEYSDLMGGFLTTILHGFWARFFFFAFILLGFWTGVRSRNPTFAAVCLFISAIIAYCGGLVDWIRT